jgi:uncharacterized protein (TIGR03643 family)
MAKTEDNNYCYYSDLPSPMAYMDTAESLIEDVKLNEIQINRIIEMAWEDRTPFEAIAFQFKLNESEVRNLMRKHLRPKSYILWRKRVENCKTKHLKKRFSHIVRFKSRMQKNISNNKISKR